MAKDSAYKIERAQKELYLEQFNAAVGNALYACEVSEIDVNRVVKWYLFDPWFTGKIKQVIATKEAEINTVAVKAALENKSPPNTKAAIQLLQNNMMSIMRMEQSENINLDKVYKKKKPLKAFIMLRYPVARYIENSQNKADVFKLCNAMSPDLTYGEFEEGTTPRTWWENYTVNIVRLQAELGWDVRRVHKVLSECQRHFYLTPLGTVNPYIKELIEYNA